jgi:hypothetical protein
VNLYSIPSQYIKYIHIRICFKIQFFQQIVSLIKFQQFLKETFFETFCNVQIFRYSAVEYDVLIFVCNF